MSRLGLDRLRSFGWWEGAAVIDLSKYAMKLLTVFVALSAAVTLLLGGRLLAGIKWGLFLLGWSSFGYATLLLRAGDQGAGDVRSGSRLGQVLNRLIEPLVPDSLSAESDSGSQPPKRGSRLPDSQKLFVASLLILCVSFLMEWLFGVTG
jgi:hypothetical protein